MKDHPIEKCTPDCFDHSQALHVPGKDKVEKLTQTTWEELAPKLLSFYAGVSSKLPADVLLRDRNLYRHVVQYFLAALGEKDQERQDNFNAVVKSRNFYQDQLAEKDREIERLKKCLHEYCSYCAEDHKYCDSVMRKELKEQDSLLRQVVGALEKANIYMDQYPKMRKIIDEVFSLPALQPYRSNDKKTAQA